MYDDVYTSLFLSRERDAYEKVGGLLKWWMKHFYRRSWVSVTPKRLLIYLVAIKTYY